MKEVGEKSSFPEKQVNRTHEQVGDVALKHTRVHIQKSEGVQQEVTIVSSDGSIRKIEKISISKDMSAKEIRQLKDYLVRDVGMSKKEVNRLVEVAIKSPRRPAEINMPSNRGVRMSKLVAAINKNSG